MKTRHLSSEADEGERIEIMRGLYLFNTGWGILLSLLIPVVIFRVTLIRAFRDLEGWEMLKASLIVLSGWFLLGFFPGNLVWLWDLLKWIDYDILFVGLFVVAMVLLVLYRIRNQESEQLIFGCTAAVAFGYIFLRVVYLYATGKTTGLFAFLF